MTVKNSRGAVLRETRVNSINDYVKGERSYWDYRVLHGRAIEVWHGLSELPQKMKEDLGTTKKSSKI